jgi:hypothetical protein
MGDQEIKFGEGAPPAEVKTFSDAQIPEPPKPPEVPQPPVENKQPEAPQPPIENKPPEEPVAVFNPMPDPIIKAPEPIFQPMPDPVDSASASKSDNPLVTPASQTIPDASNPEMGGAAKSFFDQLKTKQEPSSGAETGAPPANEDNIFAKMNFFGSDKKEDGASAAQASGKPKRKHANFLFYVVVIGLAVIFVSIFIMTQKTAAERRNISLKPIDKKVPFFLTYKKQITTPDNIFFFALNIENGAATFVLDDLKNQVHYKAVKKVKPNSLEALESEIKSTNFMTLTQEMPVNSKNGIDEERTLIIGQDKNYNKITVKNTYAKSSFEQIEAAIDEFADKYDFRTIALTSEEKKAEADKAFYKAEQLFDNFEGKPENLREAIDRYNIVINMLDSFSPKPKKWDIARKKRQEANQILEARIKELTFDYSRYLSLKEYEKARDACAKIVQMARPESKIYKISVNNKTELDKYLRLRSRK